MRRCVAAIALLALSADGASAQVMTAPGKLDVSSSGAATYTIPIAVPPGTAGVKPALTLEYSSQNQSGILGMGWALGGLPAFTRCPQTMIQNGVGGAIKFDANDRFCLEGHQLVAVSGTYGADSTEYRTEIESYSRVISHGSAGTGPAWFEVRTKSGQIMQFGNTTDSRPLTPAGTARSWLINKLSDTKGNYLTATYTNDATNGQIYPTRIDYTGNASASLAPYNSVQFQYATRPDIVPLYHAGVMTKTTVRLTNVKTYSGTTLVSDYRLAYEQGPGSLRSRITSITPCAGDGSCLPASTFAWTNGGLGTFTQFSQTLHNPFGNSPATLFGDFNGDGKGDFLLIIGNGDGSTSTIESYLSNGDGSFTNVEQVITGVDIGSPAGWTPGLVSIVMGDFNGDGKADFLLFDSSSTPNAISTFLGNGDGTFTLVSSTLNNEFGSIAGYTLAGDINGDGKTDFMFFMRGYMYVLISAGDGTFAPSIQAQSARATLAGDVNGDGRSDAMSFGVNVVATWLGNADGTLTLVSQNIPISVDPTQTPIVGDFNGDGKTDVCWVKGNTLATFLSNGDGTFTLVNQTVSTNFGAPATNTYAPITGDFNGDGKTDFTLVGATTLSTFLSNGDGTFTVVTPQTMSGGRNLGTPPQNGWFPLSGDYRGLGKTDLAFLKGTNLAGWFSDGGVPDLLASITTGLGVTTTITYKPLAQSLVYTKDTNGTYPTIDMIGPIQVVSRIDTANGIGGTYSMIYSYAGAKGDFRGRFLGFRQMTVTDLQTNIVQTANFRQDYPYIGMVDTSISKLGTQTLKQSANTYQVSNASGASTISTPSVTSAPYRVSVAQVVVSSHDLDGTALPTVTTTNQFDAFGNATQVVVSTPDGFSKTTTSTFTNDTVNWFLGRLTASTVVSTKP